MITESAPRPSAQSTIQRYNGNMSNAIESSIRLSPSARQRIQQFLAAKPEAVGLRFGVKKTGCSGWGYALDLADAAREDDTVLDIDGVPLLIDAQSLTMLRGTEIDYVREGLNHNFVFRNPNAAAQCGCGESFTTEDPGEVGF